MQTGLDLVELFTDGACSGNPGPGGWGVILRCRGKERSIPAAKRRRRTQHGAHRRDRRAKALKKRCHIKIYTDSQYVANAITKGWAVSWRRNGWRKADKKPALNAELWEELLKLLETQEYEIIWVKGHAGHPENERCDQLAVAQSQKFR